MFSKSLVQTGPNLSYILLAMDQYPTQNQFRADKAGLSPNGIIGFIPWWQYLISVPVNDGDSFVTRRLLTVTPDDPMNKTPYPLWELPDCRAWVWKSTTLHVDGFFLDWIHELSYFPYYRIAILGTCSPFEDVVMSLWSFYWLQWLPFDFQIFSWSFSTKKHSSSPFAWLKSWKPEGFLSFWEIRTLDDWKFITPGMFSYLFIFMLFVMFC